MHISGLAAHFKPTYYDQLMAALDQFPWVECHQVERTSGKMVLVMEGASVDAETEQLKTLMDLEGMATVSLVYHAFDESTEISPGEDNLKRIVDRLNQEH